ncbi:MAG: Ryanodine receptor Ryr [Bacteroidales bacterium]|nr:Ryanodine receptor Ryr [Bacteroidales bacterium]
MNENRYTPSPVDTSQVKLSDELMELAELMAENVHEVWSATRFAQGWTYGPERNDVEKKHPCLVPYEQLSEEEKIFDRNTSIETLKFIVKNGFEISRKKK